MSETAPGKSLSRIFLRETTDGDTRRLLPKGAAMAKTFFCEDDGETIRGADDDELVAHVESHIADKHPDLVGKVTREYILAGAKEE
jgi:hypothetical protein